MFDVLVIGGGAAGFYGAIHIAEAKPSLKIGILERGKDVLSKVKISGGGRCNVTHAEFDPQALTLNYPRGEKELLGPFNRYGSGDTIAFFNRRGITLKIEEDGRMFPESDTSQTIIDCFMASISQLGIALYCNNPVRDLQYDSQGSYWKVDTDKASYQARILLLATGSNPKIWHMLGRLGHTVVSPVPSLFTFNINDERLNGLQGISTPARIEIQERKPTLSQAIYPLKNEKVPPAELEAEGPLLITHWGLSGPAVLKLSSRGAFLLNTYNYNFGIKVNWLPEYHTGGVYSLLREIKDVEGKKTVYRTRVMDFPRRLWARLVLASGIGKTQKWADMTKQQMGALNQQLTASVFQVDGKSTFKEEFVTAGGIDLSEIDFRTFQSKRLPGLYFAGEIMNVDALTGGFNFQNAWTGAYIAAKGIAAEARFT